MKGNEQERAGWREKERAREKERKEEREGEESERETESESERERGSQTQVRKVYRPERTQCPKLLDDKTCVNVTLHQSQRSMMIHNPTNTTAQLFQSLSMYNQLPSACTR